MGGEEEHVVQPCPDGGARLVQRGDGGDAERGRGLLHELDDALGLELIQAERALASAREVEAEIGQV